MGPDTSVTVEEVLANGSRVSSAPKLKARNVRISDLDGRVRERLWHLYSGFYDDTDRATFDRDLGAKDRVILLRDTADGLIRGFSTLQSYTTTVLGRSVRVVFSGDTIIEPAYWGQTALQWAFLRNGIRQKLLHPHLPVYWFLITKGYKTYLLLSRNFPEYWPRHDAETPRWQQALLHDVSRARFGAAYDAKRGVLRFDECQGRLKAEVAPISETALESPDIRFFVTRNPRHQEGEELCCIGRIGAGLAAQYLRRVALKRRARGR